MIASLKAWFLGVTAAILAGLIIALRVVTNQRDEAEQRANTIKERIKQRDRVIQADQKAKQEGETHVEKAVERARSGSRDHFE